MQHILASTSANGTTVVWDLKRQRPVISFNDPNLRARNSCIQWNPEVATQLIVASDDDRKPMLQVCVCVFCCLCAARPFPVSHRTPNPLPARSDDGNRIAIAHLASGDVEVTLSTPAESPAWPGSSPGSHPRELPAKSAKPAKSITLLTRRLWVGPAQVWDLRNAVSPHTELAAHGKGVLSMAWCESDSSLLLSCAKDNRTYCWDTNSGEVVAEVPASANWNFDVQWSPRCPGVLSTASFDGKLSLHNLQVSQREMCPNTCYETGESAREGG